MPGSRIISSNKIKIIIIKVLYGVIVVACLITNSRTAERKFQIFFRNLLPVKLFTEEANVMDHLHENDIWSIAFIFAGILQFT